jgi:hypothetical protein
MNKKNWTTEDLFEGKPEAFALFRDLEERIEALGEIEKIVTKTQVSYGAKRKFAWLWMAPASKKAPEGVLMLTLDMTQKVTHPIMSSVKETYPSKWTHQIPIKGEDDIREVDEQGWLPASYQFGTLESKQKGK